MEYAPLLTDPSDLNPTNRVSEKKCPNTAGDSLCQRCVEKGDCPSGKTTVEEIQEVERGMEDCLGQH